MTKSPFAIADGAIIQCGYVVADRAAAMRQWTKSIAAGPWFTIDAFAGADPIYRGKPAVALCNIALGFSGAIQIELIEPCDDHPSVYREMLDRGEYGFHHFGVAARDLDRAAQDLDALGYQLAFSARVPSGGRVAYFDTGGKMPGMIELIEADAGLIETFGAMHAASVGWNKMDPVRALAPRDASLTSTARPSLGIDPS